MSHSRDDGRDTPRRWALVRSAGCSIGLLLVLFACVGCATTRQSAEELNAGLAWFVPPAQAGGWPSATDTRTRLERTPLVVIAWSPASSPEGEASFPATRAMRESWIAAIKENLARSGRVSRVEGSSPDAFDGGVTVAAIQTLAAERHADLVLLFGLETTKRRYHAFEPLAGAGGPADVVSVVEVVALARTVGLTPSGVPLFADTQKGFASGDIRTRTVEELEATSKRVAVDALADAIIHRLREIAPEGGSP